MSSARLISAQPPVCTHTGGGVVGHLHLRAQPLSLCSVGGRGAGPWQVKCALPPAPVGGGGQNRSGADLEIRSRSAPCRLKSGEPVFEQWKIPGKSFPPSSGYNPHPAPSLPPGDRDTPLFPHPSPFPPGRRRTGVGAGGRRRLAAPMRDPRGSGGRGDERRPPPLPPAMRPQAGTCIEGGVMYARHAYMTCRRYT